jgi:hypothetical protein
MQSAVRILVVRRGREIEVRGDHIHVVSNLMVIGEVFPTDRAVADALGVHPSTVGAWWSGRRPAPANSLLLARLATLIRHHQAIVRVGAIRRWLTSSQVELEGHSPIESLKKGEIVQLLRFPFSGTRAGGE